MSSPLPPPENFNHTLCMSARRKTTFQRLMNWLDAIPEGRHLKPNIAYRASRKIMATAMHMNLVSPLSSQIMTIK